jgi:hypothetical protein
MTYKAIPSVLALITLICMAGHANAQSSVLGDGEGVDSQILAATPGPSNFPTVQSSDIASHLGVTFAGLFGYYREPLGMEVGGKEKWVVEDVFSADFLWAFGLFDIFQIGLVLPMVLDQDGVGATPLQPASADDADYVLASSALRDIRMHVKTRFLGGGAEIPDRRDFGLALDVGLSVPSGDELSFAGENGVMLLPTVILDFHRCKLSAAINVGARLRFGDEARLADTVVGHQGTFGAGLTGHYFKRRLLLSAEGVGVLELDGFDRLGFEYRGGVGVVPDKERGITLWLSGGSSAGTGDLLGTPALRVLVGISYAPGEEGESCCGGF